MSNAYKSTKVRAFYVTGDCVRELWIIMCYYLTFYVNLRFIFCFCFFDNVQGNIVFISPVNWPTNVENLAMQLF